MIAYARRIKAPAVKVRLRTDGDTSHAPASARAPKKAVEAKTSVEIEKSRIKVSDMSATTRTPPSDPSKNLTTR